MAIDGPQGSLNVVRQSKLAKVYAVPRFRVTLIRDNRAVPPSLPMRDSLSAAAILRPLFAGLDVNNSSCAVLTRDIASSSEPISYPWAHSRFRLSIHARCSNR